MTKVLLFTIPLSIALTNLAYASNPACQVSESKATADLAAKLESTYPNSYSNQKMLLDSGMENFEHFAPSPVTQLATEYSES
jgi:hypothetical protein